MRPARMAPPAGPDFYQAHGEAGRCLQARQAAARGHQVDRLAEAELAQIALEPQQIARHEGTHVGVGDGRGGALVLARLRAGLARQRHTHARAHFGEDFADARLVRGIGVGMDQGHGDGLDIQLRQPPGDAAHRRLVQRSPHGTVHVHALRHRETQLAWHQRPRLDDVDVVLVEAALVGDLDHVAEAVGGDQRRARPLALDNGVGGERGAVHEHADVTEFQAGLGECAARALDHGHLRLARRGQQLGDEAALASEQHDVGEGPADVDGQPGGPAFLAHECCPSFWVGAHQTPTAPPPARGRWCRGGAKGRRRGSDPLRYRRHF